MGSRRSADVDVESLVAELHELRQHCDELEQAARTGQEVGPTDREVQRLNDALAKLQGLPLEQDLFQHVAAGLRQLAPTAFVLSNVYHRDEDTLETRAFIGPPRLAARLLELLGKSPVGQRTPITDEHARQALLAGRLVQVPGGLHELIFGILPRPVCRTLERVFRIGEIYTLGFVWDGQLHGNAVLALRAGRHCSRTIVETYALQASSTLQRREVLLRLQQSEARFRSLAHLLPLGVYECDPHGLLTYVNQRALDNFGYTADDMGRLTIWDMIEPRDHQRAKDNVARLRAGNGSQGEEYLARRKDQSTFPVAIFSTPVHQGETVLGLRGVLLDLTERKRDEQERDTMQQRILQSQKLESLGGLVAGVAHDFNNLLAVMSTNLELIGRHLEDDPRAAGPLADAKSAADQAADLVQQMLVYAGQAPHEPRELDLARLLTRMRHPLQAPLPDGVDLRLELDDELPPVHADSARIQQAVMNLALNAAEASRNEPGQVLISLEACSGEAQPRAAGWIDQPPAPGPHLRLAVQDQGEGMTDEVRARIFDPFFTTRLPGRGLGLCAVLGIVRSHEGVIRVETRPGQGTTVSLYLPLEQLTPDDELD